MARGKRGGKRGGRVGGNRGNNTQKEPSISKKQANKKKDFFDAMDKLISGNYTKIVGKNLNLESFKKYISQSYDKLNELLAALEKAKSKNAFEGKKINAPLSVLILHVQSALTDNLFEQDPRLNNIKNDMMSAISEDNFPAFNAALEDLNEYPKKSREILVEYIFRFCLSISGINSHFPSLKFSKQLIELYPKCLELTFILGDSKLILPSDYQISGDSGCNVLHYLLWHYSENTLYTQPVNLLMDSILDVLAKNPDYQSLLLQKGTFFEVTPVFLMLREKRLDLFKKSVSILAVKKINSILSSLLLFQPSDINFNFSLEVDQENFGVVLRGDSRETLNEISELLRRTDLNLKNKDDECVIRIPVDYALVCLALKVSHLLSCYESHPLLYFIDSYEENQLFLADALTIYPEFLLTEAYSANALLFHTMIIGHRDAFDFFLRSYKDIIISSEQNIEKELIETFEGHSFSPYHIAYQKDHRRKSSIRFPDFYVNRYIKSSDDKKMGASHFDPEGFDILCRKFPEYINLSGSRLEPILFTTIESEDLRSLNRFRGNEFVDWHIEYNGMYPLDKVLEKKNPRLTNMFLEILFTKGNQLNFMLVVSEDAGIELTINVSHPNDGGTDYLVKLNLGGLQENFDITICNEHLTNYAYLQYVSLLTQVIQGETCLDIQKLLIDYHDRERMRMDVSGIVAMGIYSGSTKINKVFKGKKLKKEDSGNIQLITEDTEDAATHVTFLERTVLLEEGGCLVKTQTPNVYVYCDETFWNDENPDMIETIKTGKFYLRGAGYAIRATINAEGFENIETSVPMKFNTGRGDRVYCAQLKDDIIDNLGKQCTIYLPCKYVSAGNHDQYVKGGNIEFDLHLPDLKTAEYEITILPKTFS